MYALTFAANTSGYRLHVRTCSQAQSIKRQNTHLIGSFETIDAAREYANSDESEKAGATTRANFKICKCAK